MPFDDGIVKISSTGFKDAKYPIDEVPFDHPLGLMFAIAAYFRAGGVHIEINSASPPRSALGGSSVAAVSLIAALLKVRELQGEEPVSIDKIAMLAHAIEESVAGVPCGIQDQLSAAYGGVNAWFWVRAVNGPSFIRKAILEKPLHNDLEKHLLVAYCGKPHVSKDINGRWVRSFLAGYDREKWKEIITCTQKFIESLCNQNYKDACTFMNRETGIRKMMTPDVLDDMGNKLFEAAMENNCGARFTGAGGGGCLWALGDVKDIQQLSDIWRNILSINKDACLLDVKIDSEGLKV